MCLKELLQHSQNLQQDYAKQVLAAKVLNSCDSALTI
jgi:hypothetical protein